MDFTSLIIQHEEIKESICRHPLTAMIPCYESFELHKGDVSIYLAILIGGLVSMLITNVFCYQGIYLENDIDKASPVIFHAIVVVGYGKENGIDYFLIKNSWGPPWGMGGYGKVGSHLLYLFKHPIIGDDDFFYSRRGQA